MLVPEADTEGLAIETTPLVVAVQVAALVAVTVYVPAEAVVILVVAAPVLHA